MPFAEKLKTLRLEHHMTQEEVANRLSVARPTIAGYETKNRQPSLENLSALAKLFDVTVDYLVTDKNMNESINLAPSRRAFPSDEERELLISYQKLSPESRRLLMDFIRVLEKAEQNTQKRQNL